MTMIQSLKTILGFLERKAAALIVKTQRMSSEG